VYETWDVNAVVEGRVKSGDKFSGNPMYGEAEKAMLAGIPTSRIRGAYPVTERGELYSVRSSKTQTM
jgi:hypothetical protein